MTGVGPSAADNPHVTFDGIGYYTDGQRVVMWITGEQNSIGEIEVLDLSPWHTGHISD